jgi:hypothetical protein
MESVVTPKVGSIVARSSTGTIGLILYKGCTAPRGRAPKRVALYTGRVLEFKDIDCEYRIMQIREGKLTKRKWQSVDPFPIGFLPPDEVKTLLAGGSVTRGCA